MEYSLAQELFPAVLAQFYPASDTQRMREENADQCESERLRFHLEKHQ